MTVAKLYRLEAWSEASKLVWACYVAACCPDDACALVCERAKGSGRILYCRRVA